VATDYKRVKVEVSWLGGLTTAKPVRLWTDVAPRGYEGQNTGGTVEVTVVDAVAQKVANALVHLEAGTATPSVSLDILTDNEGKVTLPGAPVCDDECYRVIATKTGMTSDRTYARSEVANPNKPDMSVAAGGVSRVTLVIDKVSTLTARAYRTVSGGYVTFSGVAFKLRGNRLIGRNAYDQPVYKYDKLLVTGTGGQVVIPDLEWDSYQVGLPSGSSVDFAGSNPFLPIAVNPGANLAFNFVVAAASSQSLLVVLKDNSMAPVASASVSLVNEAVSFSASQAANLLGTPDQSQTFFAGLPSTSEPYQLTVDAYGFEPVVKTATVAGDLVESFILSPL
jgi:hypothetical protein